MFYIIYRGKYSLYSVLLFDGGGIIIWVYFSIWLFDLPRTAREKELANFKKSLEDETANHEQEHIKTCKVIKTTKNYFLE